MKRREGFRPSYLISNPSVECTRSGFVEIRFVNNSVFPEGSIRMRCQKEHLNDLARAIRLFKKEEKERAE